jgi:hypothetical protein
VLRRRRSHESLPDLLQGLRDRAARLDAALAAREAATKEPLVADIAAFVARVEGQRRDLADVPRCTTPTCDFKGEEGRLHALEKRVRKLLTA